MTDRSPTYSGILDFPRKTLPKELWDYSDKESLPSLNKNLKNKILSEVKTNLSQFQLKLVGCMLYGGSATYQYTNESDIDCSIYTEWDEKTIEEYNDLQEYFKTIEIKFGKHPIHLFLKSPEESVDYMEISDAVYDILNDEWVLPPLIMPKGFDPDKYFKPLIREAERKAKKFDTLIGDLIRSWSIMKKADEAKTDAREPEIVEERVNKEKESIRNISKKLADGFLLVRDRRYALHSKLRKKISEDKKIDRFERFQEPEIVWKYLDRSGYNKFLWTIYKAVDSGALEKALARY